MGMCELYFLNNSLNNINLKRKEDQSVDVSVLLRRVNNIHRGSRGWEGHGRKRGGGRGKGVQD